MPAIVGAVLIAVDALEAVVKAQTSGADAETLLYVVPGALVLVLGICYVVVLTVARARAARTAALVAMFPDAIIENVNSRIGDQLYRFQALVRNRALVTKRYLSHVSVSIVIDGESIQGWVGSSVPVRAFVLPKSAIKLISLSRSQATAVSTAPAMRVVLGVDGTVGNIDLLFGGGNKPNSWSLMDEVASQEVVRRANEKLGLI